MTHRFNRSRHWFAVWGLVGMGSPLIGCGGRTAGTEDPFLEGADVLGRGDVSDVASTSPGLGETPNGLSPTPGGPNATPPQTGTSKPPVNKPPTPPPPVPRPTSTVAVPVAPTATTSPGVTDPGTSTGPQSTAPSTSNTSTSTTQGPTGATGPTAEPTTSSTAGPSGSSSETSEPPPPPDMFDLPEGQAPFGLPPEYADIGWVDSHGGSCRVQRDWSDGTSCSEWSYCDNDVANRADCYLDVGSDTWNCDCADSRVSFPASAVPDSMGQACRAATALCLADLPTDSVTCEDSGYSYPGNCSQYRQCSSVHASAHGEIVKQATAARTRCYPTDVDGETSECWCGEHYYYGLRVNVSLPPESSCSVSLDVCVDGMDEGSEGAVECDLGGGTTSFSPTDCSRSYTCHQPGLSGDVAVQYRYDMYTHCANGVDGVWQCWCDSETPLENVSAPTANEACGVAVEQCIATLSPAVDN